MERSDEPVILGRFVQSGGDLGTFAFGNEKLPRDCEKHLDTKVIKRVNVDGIPLDCKRKYRDFQNDNEELIRIQAFHSTQTLEKFISLSNFEAKRKTIVARSSAICSLIFPILYLQALQSRRLTFRKNGNFLYIQAGANYNRVHGIPFENQFAISAEMITQENVFDKEDIPSLGDNSVYRVIQHSLGDVDLVVSKEHDAVDENDEPVEVRGVPHGVKLNLSKFIFKSLFLGATQKAIINLCRDRHLVGVHFIDSLNAIDNFNNLKTYKKKTKEVFQWLWKFIEATNAEEGEILSSEAGIVVKEGIQGENRRYSIFNVMHPQAFELYDGWTKPKVFLRRNWNGSKPSVPFIDAELMSGSHYNRPCINYFHTKEDTDLTLQTNSFVFAQNGLYQRGEKQYFYPTCNVLYPSQFVQFLEDIFPGAVPIRPGNQPVLCIQPDNFDCYVNNLRKFHIVRNIPWTHTDGVMNYILFVGGADQLCKLLSLHRWLTENRKSIPLRFTVVSIHEFPVPPEHIRQTMSAIGDFDEENLIIHSYEGQIQKGYEVTFDGPVGQHVLAFKRPIVCISPNIDLRIKECKFRVNKDKPWSLSETETNYIVFSGGLHHLVHFLSLHIWLRKDSDADQKTASLTVISINTVPHTKSSIEEIVQLFEKEQNCSIDLELISLSTNPCEYAPVLWEILDSQITISKDFNLTNEVGPSHKLFLVGKNGKVRVRKQNCDIQLVEDFVEHGLLPLRKCPTKIEVVANQREIEAVRAKYEELRLSVPMSFNGPC